MSVLAGSSPLTRGKLTNADNTGKMTRLIPAHAGKTVSVVDGGGDNAAHPRSRGENAVLQRPSRSRSGSSPLTRGKPWPTQPVPSCGRLIPAHAGKTKSVLMTSIARAAHPRSRGENGYTPGRDVFHFGSSPLTRGKRRGRPRRTQRRGLIPAHAGKT